MASELLLLHGINTGGRKMARKGCSWVRTFNPRTGTFMNRCNRRRKASRRGLLGDIGSLPSGIGEATSIRGMFADVKGVVINGAVAVAGAVIADKLFSYILQSMDKKGNFVGMKRHAAEMATGIAVGLAVGKLLKKPRIAVLVAIGPVVVAGLKMVGELLHSGPFAGPMQGLYGANLGMMAIEPYREILSGASANTQLNGAMQIGPGVPSWMTNPEFAGDPALY